MPLATIRQVRAGKALFWRCVQEAWGPLATGVPAIHQQIMPAGAAPCAGRLADMTRDARLAMDAGNNDRLASIPNKKQTSVFMMSSPKTLVCFLFRMDASRSLFPASIARRASRVI